MKMLGLDPTAVHDSAEFALGTRGQDQDGREFVYVDADATITAGDVCIVHDDFGAEGVTTTNSAPGTGAGKQVGVAMADLTSSEFGWLCVYGTGSDILASVLASAAAFTRLNTTGTAGALDDDASVGAEVVEGLVITTAASGSAELEVAVVNYPYVGATLA